MWPTLRRSIYTLIYWQWEGRLVAALVSFCVWMAVPCAFVGAQGDLCLCVMLLPSSLSPSLRVSQEAGCSALSGVELWRILLQTLCLDCLPNCVEGPWAPRKELRSSAESGQGPQEEQAGKVGAQLPCVGGHSLVPLLVLGSPVCYPHNMQLLPDKLGFLSSPGPGL